MNDELKALGQLSLEIALDVAQALRASLVLSGVKLLVHSQPDWFKWDPGNTLHYAAVSALEERSIVAISEHVKVSSPRISLPPDVAEAWQALEGHRHALSHPSSVTWKFQWMRDFAKQKRHYLESRSALVWRAQQIMNQRLSAAGLQTFNAEIEVTHEMAATLQGVLLYSTKAESGWRGRTTDEWMATLRGFRNQYVTYMESAHAEFR